MRIPIISTEVNSLDNMFKELTLGDELEIRLGSWSGHSFVSGVSNQIFVELISILSLKQIPEHYKSISTSFSSGIRKIETIYSTGNKITYEKKLRKQVIDLKLYPVCIRTSIASETAINPSNITESILGKIVNVRNRERTTFVFPKYKLDLTKVISAELTVFEIEAEFITIPKNIHDFMSTLKEVCEYTLPDRLYILPSYQVEAEIHEFNYCLRNYIKQSWNKNLVFSYEAKTKNLKRDILSQLSIGYYLHISSTGVYLINSTNVDRLSKNWDLPEYKNTILQGEWFENKFWIFDVLFIGSQDMTQQNHRFRLQSLKPLLYLLNKALMKANSSTQDIVVKKHFQASGNLTDDIKITLENMNKTYGDQGRKNNDGFILTPIKMRFQNQNTYKFKFPELMTIDFELRNRRFISNKIVFDPYVADVNNKLTRFRPTQFPDTHVEINIDSKWSNLDSNFIAECEFERTSGHWSICRLRLDKTKPNFISVAKDIFEDILNPLDLPEIYTILSKLKDITTEIGNTNITNNAKIKIDVKNINDTNGTLPSNKISKQYSLDEMRKYHNEEKMKLILKYATKKNVLDIGFGRAGDIHKYQKTEVNFVYGIEPNEEFRTEANNRIAEKPEIFRKRIKILPFRAQETQQINNEIAKTKIPVNAVASFFSLSFFFEDENQLDRLVETIDSNLKTNDFFFGTTIDGEKVDSYLTDKTEFGLEGVFKITRHYKSSKTLLPEIGSKITVHYNDTIVNDQDEYLVMWDDLVEKLSAKNIVLVSTQLLNSLKTSSNEIRVLSNFYRNFVFQKLSESHSKWRRLTSGNDNNDLKMLAINDQEDFRNDFYPQEQLIRIGTTPDGSCFFNSVLYALMDEYKNLEPTKRTNTVKKLRAKIANSLTMNKFLNLGNGFTSLNLAITEIEKKMKTSNRNDNPIFQVIDNANSHNWEEFQTQVLSLIKDDSMSLIKNTLQNAIESAFALYTKKIQLSNVWVGLDNLANNSVDVFEFVSELLETDIYVVRDHTRIPYFGFNCTQFQHRRSIFLLLVSNCHYELLGKKDQNGKLKTVFDPEDNIVKRAYQIVCEQLRDF